MYICPETRTIVRTSRSGVSIRELCAPEAAAVVDAVFRGLSAQSRYLRFHSPVSHLSDPLRRQLVNLEDRQRAALVAEAVDHAGSTPIGLAHLAGTDTGSADVAVAVVDAWQRRGVGRRLLAAAVELADELGYTELRGTVLPENRGMRRLAGRFPQARTRFGGDVVDVVIPLGPAAYAVTHEDVLADLLYRGD
jgi:GNAT superfamily N-acetyltransferase